MRPSRRFRFPVSFLVGGGLLLAGCGGNSSPSAPDDPGGPDLPEPSGPISTTVSPDGTSLRVVTDEGVVVELDFPADAVWAPTDVTLTPVAPPAGGWMGIRLEPAGLRLLRPAAVRATFPPEVQITDPVLRVDNADGSALVGATFDPATRILRGALPAFFGSGGGGLQAPGPMAMVARNSTSGGLPANLSAVSMTCSERAAAADGSLNQFLAESQFQQALRLAMNVAGLLQLQACGAEADAWLQTASQLACGSASDAIATARDAAISSYGDFDAQVRRILYWLAQVTLLGAECPAVSDGSAALETKYSAFLQFFDGRIQPLQSDDWSTFQDLKDESVSALRVSFDASTLGLSDTADRIMEEAFKPTVRRMRSTAYTLCRRDGWHYALSRVTSTGYFAARDIVGQTPPRPGAVWPPPTDYADFTDQEIFEDLQQCGTDLRLETIVTSGGVLDSVRVGGGEAPGSHVTAATLDTPTRGQLRFGGEIFAFRCWNDIEGDDRIEVLLDGTVVRTLDRPSGDEYLGGQPLELDLQELADSASITPSEGESHDLVLRRHRTQCDPRLWGPAEFDLVTATLEWKNPTLQVEVTAPAGASPGDEVATDTRVTVIDQLGEPTYEAGIAVELDVAGGSAASTSGETDEEGYFRTTLAIDPSASGTAVVTATATASEGVTAQGTANVEILGGYVRVVRSSNWLDIALSVANSDTADIPDRREDRLFDQWSYSNALTASASVPETGTADASVEQSSTLLAGSQPQSASQVTVDGTFRGSLSYTPTPGGGSSRANSLSRFSLLVEVVGGPVTYTINGSLAASETDPASRGSSEAYLDFVRTEDGGGRTLELLYQLNQDNAPTLDLTGVLQPGFYSIGSGAQGGGLVGSNGSCFDGCEWNGEAITSVTITFGSVP